MSVNTPRVSVIIPCLNELEFIGRCLDSIVASGYLKDRLEVLVIDGMSVDDTRTIIEEYTRKYSFIRMVDNPERIKPIALNIGIREAKGSVIIRMDAHATYESDYISKCIEYLVKYDADNVGGIRRTLPGDESLVGRAIAYSISHPFTAGNAHYRTGAKTVKWVDTVFGGCYRRDVFEKIGLFDEALIRGQDREFNERLRRSGGKILLVPDIVCSYFARTNPIDFARWIFVGGLTPFYISKITRRIVFSWRNLVPVFAVLGLLLLLLLSLAMPVFWRVTGWVISCYLVLCLCLSVPIAKRERDIRLMFVMPFIFAVTHTLYGIGSLVGMFKRVDRHTEWSKV